MCGIYIFIKKKIKKKKWKSASRDFAEKEKCRFLTVSKYCIILYNLFQNNLYSLVCDRLIVQDRGEEKRNGADVMHTEE